MSGINFKIKYQPGFVHYLENRLKAIENFFNE